MLLAVVPWLTALSLSVLVSAQGSPIATTSNATYSVPNDYSLAIRLLLSMSPGGTPYSLAALTPEATSLLQNVDTDFLNGTIVERDSNNLSQTIDGGAFAYISCDASDYPGFTDINNVVDNAVVANVSAIILYSQTSVQCNLTGDAPNGYTRIYSTTAARDAMDIQSALNGNMTSYILNANTLQRLGTGGVGGSSSTLGARSTAVAMIILYSITGIITALFLLIIVSGAVRAHRHPERYGPRNAGGRSRQSRARGIARAMLETIPIVKFGDNEPPKDVEMSDPVDSSQRQGNAANAASTAPAARAATATSDAAAPATTSASGTQAASAAPGIDSNSSSNEDDVVTCSICTEDFEKGQDIRLLPCNHKFHPACVDPWLLDVSGTCPLCRVDLRPAETSGQAGEDGDMPPPLDPAAAADAANSNSTGGRLRGLLRRLQPATAEERIAALRRFREENAQTREATGAEAQSEEGHASRWERVRRRVGL